MTAFSPVIQVKQLTKLFPAEASWQSLSPFHRSELNMVRPAVDHASFTVYAGEFFGLLGPNGAGKTTLLKMLSTLILPTSGEANISGYSLHQEQDIKRQIGLCSSDERSFYWRLTGRQNLAFFSELQGLNPKEITNRITTVLTQVELSEVADKRFQVYSTGMRQRLAIARALLRQPRILFLDEPSKGLDPLATRHFHTLLHRLREQQQLTILFTTHRLDEAETLCERVAIMHQGRILACNRIDALRQQVKDPWGDEYYFTIEGASSETITNLSEKSDSIRILDQGLERTRLQVRIHKEMDLPRALEMVQQNGGRLVDIEHHPASLEQIFSKIVEQGIATEVSTAKLQAPVDPQTRILPVESSNQGQEFTPKIPAFAPTKFEQQKLSQLKSRTSTDRTHNICHRPVRLAYAFVRRDLHQEMSYRFSFVLQVFNIVFMIGVYYFISRLFAASVTPELINYRMDYFTFVLIGIALTQYFNVSLTSFTTQLRQAQMTGTLEAMLSTPTRISAIILSSSLWEFGMSTLRVIAYLGAGILLLDVKLNVENFPLAIVILILTIAVFSSLGILAASFIMVLKRGDPVTWLFSGISALLGGVYYPISVLPEWLQWFSRMLPVTYALDAMRLALKPGVVLEEIVPSLFILLLFGCVLLPGSLFAFRFAVRRARLDGSLTHY